MVPAAEEQDAMWSGLGERAERELREQGGQGEVTVRRVAACRYAGQSHELRVSAGSDLVEAFHKAHAEAYGYRMDDQQVQLVTAHAVAEGEPVLDGLPKRWDQGEGQEAQTRSLVIAGDEVEARIVHRSSLEPGDELAGPALVVQSDTTTLLPPGERAQVDEHRNLVITLYEGPGDG
ncbi:MAG: hypothetical protein ACR2MA_06980 [Egibacteraceae bacterium]